MGELWQYSLQILNINKRRKNEIKKIVSEIFDIDVEVDGNKIEIWNQRIYANLSFYSYAIDELKKRLWKNDYIEFRCAIHVVENTIPESFKYNEYVEFKNNYIDI